MKPDAKTIELKLPFDPTTVENIQSYLAAMIELIHQEDEMRSFDVDGTFAMEYGSVDRLHILYFGACDLAIMMTPDTGTWRACRVYLAHIEGAADTLANKFAMKKLFSYKNPHRSYPQSEDFKWAEETGVFVDAPLTKLTH